jgi:ActR/RegA family two-component response regulator
MARTFAALLVDSDLKGLESLVYGFQGVSWRSTACAAPETAALLVKASAADLAVIAVREPHDKILALLRQLRSSAETRTLPLLVIGPASLRASVQDCGSIDFLTTPIFVRDVITASRILVSLRNHTAHLQDREAVIDGPLTDFGFFSLIRVMSGLRRSGVLQVERANRRGEILFSDGDIAGAQVGSLQGPPAIHHLLLWEEAKIELHLRAVVRRSQFNQRSDQIIDEAERFVRDYTYAIQGIGPSTSVYEKNDDKLAKATVPTEVTPVLRLCDGRRTLTDIMDESPFRVFDTVRILTRLVDLGVLTRRKTQDLASAPTPPLQKFWETARIASSGDSVALPLSQRPTPVRVGQADMRIGEPGRRKAQRRASIPTPAQGTPIIGAAATPAAGAPNTASLATPIAQATAVSKAKVSGTIDLHVAGDRRQTKSDRRSRPSVTIDAALVEAAVSPAPAVVSVGTTAAPAEPPARAGRTTGTMQVAPSSDRRRSTTGSQNVDRGKSIEIDPGLASETNSIAKASSPAIPLSQLVTEAAPSGTVKAETPGTGQSDATSTARVTGTLTISPSQRSAASKAVGKGVSVELDPVLIAELGHLEKATTPIGPPASAEPLHSEPGPVAASSPSGAGSDAPDLGASAPSPAKSDHAARATGTLSVSPASRSSANALKTPARGISVALDPDLVAEAQKLAPPQPQSASATTHRPGRAAEPRTASPGAALGKRQVRGASGDRTTPVAARPTPRSSDNSERESQTGRRTSRISGDFSAVERDFFAREADLYKREAEDNFSDLDETAGKRNGRISSGRGPSKKRA